METVTLSFEMILVMGILAVTIALFAFEILRVDIAAICVMVLLGLTTMIPGIDPIIKREELFSGFSSNAVISVIAVMIIGAGLDKTGIMNRVAATILNKGGKTEQRIIPLVSGTVAIISSFMQNIGAAALFLPVVSRISIRTGLPISRLLMPMGFCAILGGTVTMIGSSPLILLNDLLESSNKVLPAEQHMEPFGLFSVTPVGLALVATGIVYFIVAGRFVLPEIKSTDSNRSSRASDYFEKLYGIKGELMEVRVTDESPQVGMTIHQVEDHHPNTPMMLALYSGDVVKVPPDREEMIWVNTRLGLMGDRKEIEKYCEENHWELLGEPDRFADVLNAQHGGIAELVVPPGSGLIGQEIGEIKPRRNFGTNILQIFRNEEVIKQGFRTQKLHAGDTLVVHASWKDLKNLSRNKDFVLATDIRYEDLRTNKVKQAVTFFSIALTLFLLTDSLSISLLTGAMGMVLSGVLTMDEAYAAVSWQTVFLLASLIPLGIAVDQSGTAAWIAQQILALVGDVPDLVLQVVIALLSTFFTLVMSNIGATVLLVPLAVNIAIAVGADPATYALIVAISTSNSFLIPTHQVNALIMGPGGYQVADFMRAGGIMTVLFLAVSLLMMNLIM
ncbi:MAG: SLC13 family permease [Granulosicoccus sp.]